MVSRGVEPVFLLMSLELASSASYTVRVTECRWTGMIALFRFYLFGETIMSSTMALSQHNSCVKGAT